MSAERPDVFRAVACMEPSRWWWITRPRRILHYDAFWDDGRIEYDVDLVEYMYRRAPADYSVVKKAIDDACPPEGTGAWVEYPYGNILPDPSKRVF
jgi:hypothetical protein